MCFYICLYIITTEITFICQIFTLISLNSIRSEYLYIKTVTFKNIFQQSIVYIASIEVSNKTLSMMHSKNRFCSLSQQLRDKCQVICCASSRSHDQPTLHSNSLVGDLVIHQCILAVLLRCAVLWGKMQKH